MPGPLPKPAGERRRRNAPTIPTTSIPTAGRTAAVPKPPRWVTLGPNALAWWRWAWKTPQAAAWSTGHLSAVARRAQLEDDLVALEAGAGLDIAEVLDLEPSDRTREVTAVVRRLHGLASGRLGVAKEMRELDDRLGLSPKAQAALRWTEVDGEPKAQKEKAPVRRLRAVEAG